MLLTQKVIIYLSMIAFSLSGIFLQTENYSYLTNYLIIIPGLILILISIINTGKKFKIYHSKIDISYYLFVVSCILSSLINKDFENLLSSFKFLLFFIVLVVIIRNLPNLFNHSLIMDSFSIASIIGILLTLVEYPISLGSENYSGIFENPNNFGVFVSTALIIFLSQLIINTQNTNYFLSVIYLLLSIFTFYLVSISASRTAFFAIFISVIIVILALINKVLLRKKIQRKYIYSIGLIAVVILLVLIVLQNSPIHVAIQENIIDKITDRGSNVLSGREFIWSRVIEISSLFGEKAGFVRDTIGFSAHNSFLAQLGQYGWFAGIFYLFYWLLGSIIGYQYFVTKYRDDPYSLFVILSIFLFMSMSKMEVLTHTFTMYIALYAIGYTLSERESYE